MYWIDGQCAKQSFLLIGFEIMLEATEWRKEVVYIPDFYRKTIGIEPHSLGLSMYLRPVSSICFICIKTTQWNGNGAMDL